MAYKIPIKQINAWKNPIRRIDVYKRWKHNYNDFNEPYTPTDEEKHWEQYLKELVPGVLPFRVKSVPSFSAMKGYTGASALYFAPGCVITVSEEKNTRWLAKIDSYIHELVHHINDYHIQVSTSERSHTQALKAAVAILKFKDTLVHPDSWSKVDVMVGCCNTITAYLDIFRESRFTFYSFAEYGRLLGVDLDKKKLLD